MRITIERSKNYSLIKALAIDPAIFPFISDDYHSVPGDWQPPTNDYIVNLLARDGRGYFGFAIFIPRTWACFDAHLGFLPRSYGKDALTAFKEMLAWMWKHSTAVRIVGEICEENRKAIAFVKRAGCEEFGVNRKSYLRGGILRDQVCLGISKAGSHL